MRGVQGYVEWLQGSDAKQQGKGWPKLTLVEINVLTV